MLVSDAGLLETHDHVAWNGRGGDDLYQLASAALADGVRRNEKLLFVAGDPDPSRLQGLGDLDRLLALAQLELVAVDSIYGATGRFDPIRQLETFEALLDEALANGYAGIRVVADNTPLVRDADEEGFRDWLRWEQLTDRFQAASKVTGICYFDRDALSDERLGDLSALHPVRSVGSVEPAFSLFVNDDVVSVTGTLDLWSSDQFARILDTTPDDRALIVDLSGAEFVDHRALLALNDAASAKRPVRIRQASRLLRELPSLIELATPHLRFE
jgi:hypothetical protein